MSLSSVTRYMEDRRSTSLRGGGSDDARVAISVSRVTIAERRLDEAADDRPRWKGRPQADEMAFLATRTPCFVPRSRLARKIAAARKADVLVETPAAEPIAPPEPVAPIVAPQPPVEAEPARMTAKRLIALAAKTAGLTVDELASEQRMRIYVRARWLAILLIDKFKPLSTPEIGRRLGNRDHTTVMHARRAIAEMTKGVHLPDDVERCAVVAFAALTGATQADERTFAFIRWERLGDAMAIGWLPSSVAPNHHGFWSTICEWRCCCGREPKTPRALESTKFDEAAA